MSALKDWVPMQDIRYYLNFDLKKYFLLAFLEVGCQGHCASLCKVLAQKDKYYRNERINHKTNKLLFEKSFLKVGL